MAGITQRGAPRAERNRYGSAMGLGCAKTPALAPHVEISLSNCISESQIILHTRGSMPCWRIVFSTFCGCMSFYTARVIRVTSTQPLASPDVRFASNTDRIGASQRTVAMCHKATYAVQQKLRSIRSPRRCGRSSTGNFWMRRRNFIALLAAARWPDPRGPTAWPGGAIFPIKSNRGFAVLARSRDLPRARSRALPAPPGQNS